MALRKTIVVKAISRKGKIMLSSSFKAGVTQHTIKERFKELLGADFISIEKYKISWR